MRKALTGILCFGLSATVAMAQDSTARHQQSDFYRMSYDFYNSDVAAQALGTLTQYGRLEAGFRYQSGSYRLAQEAPTQRDIFFMTEGTRKLGNYLLGGSFAYTHELQDSVGFTLRQGLKDPDPYYFFAYKKGNWQTGKYNLRGNISRKLMRDKLALGAGARYQALNAWRSNDPRPEQFNYRIQLQAGINYTPWKKHTFGVSAVLDTKKQENRVQYRNRDYQLSLAYPEYVKRMQYGYGFEDRASNSGLKASGSGYGWRGLYHYNTQYHTLTAIGGYSYLESDYTGDSTRYFPKGHYGSFYEDRWNAGLFWEYRKQQHAWSLQVAYTYHLGRDMNSFLRSNNYVYAFEQLSVKPAYRSYRDSLLYWELMLDLTLSDLFRADGNAGVATDYQYWEAGLAAARYFTFNSKNWLRAAVNGGMRLALSPLLTTPVQLSEFVRHVILADYYYYDATVLQTGLQLRYGRAYRECDGFLQLHLGLEHAKFTEQQLLASWKPGNIRCWGELMIGITLRR